MKNRRLMLGLLAVLALLRCQSPRPPLQIGFAGELTGKSAELGIDGRDGAQIAVEVLNESGGVAGRPLQLLIEDDQSTPEGARTAARALIAKKVVAVIGPMTSKQSMAAYSIYEAAHMITLSPTASTPELAGRADHNFSLNPVNSYQAQALARYLIRERRLTEISLIINDDNAFYTQPYAQAFSQTLRSLGGQINREIHFSNERPPDFPTLIQSIPLSQTQGVLIIAAPLDTALLAQRIRQRDSEIPLFMSGWAQTETLIQNGGLAVEGIEVVKTYNPDSRNQDFLEFKKRYQERYGRLPTFAAVQAYETLMILAAALEKTGGQSEGLQQALSGVQDFPGLTGTVSLDINGDGQRTQFLLTVHQGNYSSRTALEPEKETP